MSPQQPITSARRFRFTILDLAFWNRRPVRAAGNGSATPRTAAAAGRRATVLALTLLLLQVLPAPSWGQEKNLEPVPLAVGFTQSHFLGVNRNDGEVAFKAFTQAVGRKRGYLIKTTTTTFDNISDFEAAI